MLSLLIGDADAVSQRNRARGKQIVQALQQYKSARGAYPPKLDALVPQFIPGIPAPEDANWSYQVARDGEFDLCFDGGGPSDHVGCYSSKEKVWWVDTK